MSSDNTSVSSRSMKKWGIPEQKQVSNEQTLLERLVWVQNQGHWWPALLYQSYAELQKHLYDRLDMHTKAQFAVAIMKELQSTQKNKLARLLGSDTLEVMEVKDGQYAEFYWQLPNVLPHACERSLYGSNTQLYIDFHRALDQVEEIVQEISENKVNLLPSSPDQKSWEQRAREGLEAEWTGTFSAPNNPTPNQVLPKENRVVPKEMSTLDCNDSGMLGGLDSFMTTLSKGVDEYIYNDPPKEDTRPGIMPSSSRNTSQPQPVVHRSSSQMMEQHVPAVVSPPRHDSFQQQRAGYQEARDPSSEYYNHRRSPIKTRGDDSRGGSSANQRSRSMELLPGLEAEDILPGITETNVWRNVMKHMLSSKTGNEEEMEEASVALQRSIKPQEYGQQQRRMQGRFLGQVPQSSEDPTVSAMDVAPKFQTMSIVSKAPTGGPTPPPPRTAKSHQQPLFQYRSMPMPPLRMAEPPVESDPDLDTILADPTMRDIGLNPDSDDTLWGFLTCRATD